MKLKFIVLIETIHSIIAIIGTLFPKIYQFIIYNLSQILKFSRKQQPDTANYKASLKAFQYTAYIKTVNILLPNYKYRHTTSDENELFVGRLDVIKQLESFLSDERGGAKGSYLITGYRGMGKTSLVKKAVKNIIDNASRIKKYEIKRINISFSQKDIKEVDILKQIVFEIKKSLEENPAYKKYQKIGYFSWYLWVAVAIAMFFNFGPYFVHYLLAIIKHYESNYVSIKYFTDLFRYILPDINQFSEIYHRSSSVSGVEQVLGQILLSAIFIGLAYIIKREIAGLRQQKFASVYRQIESLYDKTTANIQYDESMGTGGEQFPLLLSRRKAKNYVIAGPKEISNEIIHLISKIKSKIKIHYIFIFDELDKIDNNLHYSDETVNTNNDPYTESASLSEHRKRKKIILEILSSLKYLITEAESRFIFIAGSEMFDAALADVSDRQSAISSIFGHILNVDSLFKDKADDAIIGTGVTNLIESYLIKIMDPKGYSEHSSILKNFFDTKNPNLSIEDQLKVVYTLQHFITYVAYRSTGSPKKMIRIIEEHTKYITEIKNPYKEIYASAHLNYPKETSQIYLTISYKDQYKIGLLSYFYRPIIISKSRTMKNFSDSLLVTIPYLMDHILKFHGTAFSMENLELVPEVLTANRSPELRSFIEELIEIFKQNLIRETETKFFEYKFNFKIYNEIIHISKIFVEESAAYNFSLDENHNIKIYLRSKIRELRGVYQHFGGDQANNALDSIALYNILLGDVCYFDREYSDAIGSYKDALTAIQTDFVPDKTGLYLHNLHFIIYIKCLMKLGLAYEKIKSYERAIACYLDSINIISKNQTLESKFLLKSELDQNLVNAVFSCLFIYEKKPPLGNIETLINHLEKTNKFPKNSIEKKLIKKTHKKTQTKLIDNTTKTTKELSNEFDIISNINYQSTFTEFIKKHPTFYNNMSLLIFYRGSCKSKDILAFIKDEKIELPQNYDVSLYCTEVMLMKMFNVDSMDEVYEKIIQGYFEKTISISDSYAAARALARLGNILYSQFNKKMFREYYNKNIEEIIYSVPFQYCTINTEDKKTDTENYINDSESNKNKISVHNLLIKKHFDHFASIIQSKNVDSNTASSPDPNEPQNFIDLISNHKEKLKKDLKHSKYIEFYECKNVLNASDLIKFWIISMNLLYNNFHTDNNQVAHFGKIIYIYLLSAKLYMVSGNVLMSSFQYRKILAIIRHIIPKNPNTGNEKYFLWFLKNSIVKRSIQVASWSSSSTDRSQVYKYKHALSQEELKQEHSFTKFNYKNTSNAADLKEAMWHYIAISEIWNISESCKNHENESNQGIIARHLRCSANQSFIHPSGNIHTMHARLNELAVQVNINHSLLNKIRNKNETLKKDNISEIYNNLRKNTNPELYSDLKITDNDSFNELPYLISNWIFCLHTMLMIMQTQGTSFLVTYSNQADCYRRLGDALKYYYICKVLYRQKNTSDKLQDFPDVQPLVEELIGEEALRSMDTTSQYQMAARYYRMALNVHQRGSMYRYLISNLCFLEDDFHDNVFHFGIAFERQRVNSEEILEKIRALNKELNLSQFFDFDAFVNNDQFITNEKI